MQTPTYSFTQFIQFVPSSENDAMADVAQHTKTQNIVRYQIVREKTTVQKRRRKKNGEMVLRKNETIRTGFGMPRRPIYLERITQETRSRDQDEVQEDMQAARPSWNKKQKLSAKSYIDCNTLVPET